MTRRPLRRLLSALPGAKPPLTPEQERQAGGESWQRLTADFKRHAREGAPIPVPKAEAGRTSHTAWLDELPTGDSPLADRLRQHLDEITADRDRLDLANGRLLAENRALKAENGQLRKEVGR